MESGRFRKIISYLGFFAGSRLLFCPCVDVAAQEQVTYRKISSLKDRRHIIL